MLGYEMYRLFYTQRQCTKKKNRRAGGGGRRKNKNAPGFVDIEEEEREKEVLERQ